MNMKTGEVKPMADLSEAEIASGDWIEAPGPHPRQPGKVIFRGAVHSKAWARRWFRNRAYDRRLAEKRKEELG